MFHPIAALKSVLYSDAPRDRFEQEALEAHINAKPASDKPTSIPEPSWPGDLSPLPGEGFESWLKRVRTTVDSKIGLQGHLFIALEKLRDSQSGGSQTH